MSEVRATCIARLPLPFPAYLAGMINGGYKTKDLVTGLGRFDLLVEAKCPFADGWVDMSARERRPDAYLYAKANLRIENRSLKVRVDNRPSPFHMDVEREGKKTQSHVPVRLDPGKPHLLSAFEIAKQELSRQASGLLTHSGSIEQPTLELLKRTWEAQFFVNSVKVQMLLPLYPGSKLTWRCYTDSRLAFTLTPGDIQLTVEPFT